MANEKNLKPFKKGHDDRRNLEGRPRALPELKDVVDDLLGSENGEVSKAAIRDVLEAQLKKAKKGDPRAAEIVLGYAYGKPPQAHVHTGKDGGPIEHTYRLPDGTEIKM